MLTKYPKAPLSIVDVGPDDSNFSNSNYRLVSVLPFVLEYVDVASRKTNSSPCYGKFTYAFSAHHRFGFAYHTVVFLRPHYEQEQNAPCLESTVPLI